MATSRAAAAASPSVVPAIVAAIAAFYPACIAWYLLLAVVSYLLFALLVPVYFLGFGDAAQAIASMWAVVRMVAANTVPTLAFALVGSLAVAMAVRKRQRRLPAVRWTWWLAAPLAVGVALLVDAANGLTPAGAVIAARLPGDTPVPTRAMTPRDFGTMRDGDTGAIARVTGVLVYHAPLRRFELVEADDRRVSISLYVRARQGQWMRDILADGVEPRVRDQLLPLVGTRVTVTGPITRGSVSALSRDVVAAPASVAPPAGSIAPPAAGIAPPVPAFAAPATSRPP